MSENAVVPTASDTEPQPEPLQSPVTPNPSKPVPPPIPAPAAPKEEERKTIVQKEDEKKVATKDATKDAKTLQEQRLLRAKAAVEMIGESYFFTILMSILTIWALYNSDIKFAATQKEADLAFEVIITIAFFLFILEIFMLSFYKPDYFYLPQWKALEDEEWHETWYRRLQFGSFYFWLDWIATLSLVLEVQCVTGVMIVF